MRKYSEKRKHKNLLKHVGAWVTIFQYNVLFAPNHVSNVCLLSGKYAMRQLVQKLPQENRAPDFLVSDDTVTAVQATLYEVIKKNADFAQ